MKDDDNDRMKAEEEKKKLEVETTESFVKLEPNSRYT